MQATVSGSTLWVEGRAYPLGDRSQDAWLDAHAAVSRDFGTRLPANRTAFHAEPAKARLRPLLTDNAAPGILYGYGDPCVLKTEEGWRLIATSNDAPDAFPILWSPDLRQWEPRGFAFPRGSAPGWTLEGENLGDFWAPELHSVGDEYWMCFTARRKDRSLAIGMATAASPEGPFIAAEQPLLGGGVIDPHIFVDADGQAFLFWKEDSNGVWPGLLCEHLCAGCPPEDLFVEEQDRRSAALARALWPWLRTAEPMEQFFALQPLVEAATADFAGFERRLRAAPGEIREALRTRVYAQPLAPDGRSLVGERTLVLQNDLPWEAHLIEGVWVTAQRGRYFMLYAGNDFSTPHYGIGAAVADHPLGPYVKQEEPLLRSTAEWLAPGHPSVAPGSDGRPHIFLHAFHPGRTGYKAFRALLTAPLAFDGDRVAVL